MKLLRLAYLLAQHPLHLHRALVRRGVALKWIDDFRPFWDTVRPPSLPITDYASFTWLEYHFAAQFRARHTDGGDHFDDKDAQYARLLSYVKRREMHPLRMLLAAWHLRHCRTVLEFGAGAAPYSYFISTAWPLPWRQEVWLADMPGLLFKYQAYAFRYTKHWFPCLDVTKDDVLGRQYDGIVCTEVFEHLEHPIDTALKMMKAAPIICFDYVEDTAQTRNSLLRPLVFNAFKSEGTLTGPDKRGLYVWRRR